MHVQGRPKLGESEILRGDLINRIGKAKHLRQNAGYRPISRGQSQEDVMLDVFENCFRRCDGVARQAALDFEGSTSARRRRTATRRGEAAGESTPNATALTIGNPSARKRPARIFERPSFRELPNQFHEVSTASGCAPPAPPDAGPRCARVGARGPARAGTPVVSSEF